MTTLEVALPSLDRTAHVRCLDVAEVAAIRRDLDAAGDADELVLAGIVRTLRQALVDPVGAPLFHDDQEAETLLEALQPGELGRLLGAALASSSDVTRLLTAIVTAASAATDPGEAT